MPAPVPLNQIRSQDSFFSLFGPPKSVVVLNRAVEGEAALRAYIAASGGQACVQGALDQALSDSVLWYQQQMEAARGDSRAWLEVINTWNAYKRRPITFLIAAGANPWRKGADGVTIFDRAVEADHYLFVDLVISMPDMLGRPSFDFDRQNAKGQTPAEAALECSSTMVLSLLNSECAKTDHPHGMGCIGKS